MELGGAAEAINALLRERERESGGLTISGEGCRCQLIDATAAPSTVSPFSNGGETMEDDHHRRHFLLPLPVCSPRIPVWRVLLSHCPSGFLALSLLHPPFISSPPPLISSTYVRVRVRCKRISLLHSSVILRAVSLRFSPAPTTPSINPPPSNPPGSSHPPRCTTCVLTVRRTSALRRTPNPLHARVSTLRTGGLLRRRSLRLSRRLSSRLETVRCAGDPGTIRRRIFSPVAMTRRPTTRRNPRVQDEVPVVLLALQNHPMALPRPALLLASTATAGSF